jgi:aerobic-type carbon monoxide dehydrogenase small subunit (CoxS/CutS family)
MGTCQACEVLVDGRRVRACAVDAEDGMRVRTEDGAAAS